jgi:predicted Rossmann fold nucleotide-binding protein DprA/Smf involved in DNA uptake
MSLSAATMSEDAKAVLLVCGRFGGRGSAEPLELRHYNELAQWLAANELRPRDLLDPDRSRSAGTSTSIGEDRLAALLERGVQLGVLVEQWSRAGLWIVGRCDAEYPQRLKAHLREQAPPILYGAGERSLLQGGGVAIVGSRNIDDAGAAFARTVAESCAANRLPVVSGGARGVDQIAMSAALEAGGTVIGILADSLLRASTARETRDAIADGRLTLLSPWHPEACFSVGAAMGRNKLIYAMADHALVVSADHAKGGTWAGAVEELRRPRHRPVFVRIDAGSPIGNSKLNELGAIAWPAVTLREHGADLAATLEAASASPERAVTASPRQSGTLFDDTTDPTDPTSSAPDSSSASAPCIASDQTPPSIASSTNRSDAATHPASMDALAANRSPSVVAPESPELVTAYDAVLPLILRRLATPIGVDELASSLDVAKPQLTAWLKRAVADGVVRRLARPVRYVQREG